MILLWIICTLQFYVTCHYPIHTDFEKLGEININNKTHKVLRPRIHIIKHETKLLGRRDRKTSPKLYHRWISSKKSNSNIHSIRRNESSRLKAIRLRQSELRKKYSSIYGTHALVPYLAHNLRKNSKTETAKEKGTEGIIVFSMYCPFLGQLQFVRRYNTVSYEPMEWWPTPKPPPTTKPTSTTTKPTSTTTKPTSTTNKPTSTTNKPTSTTTKPTSKTTKPTTTKTAKKAG
ncbi:uncharacterized protein DDB_G0290685-like [Leguminivora glycinivorella]|uniref:uncharacterized protein DDB_G0290685-like n=1 Tax=Leguminivora glycinivorella TaxID=1035111 RepID=UPI00200BE098|nr:uncharacterized protein DDB_G0290685-like [Leguminivora glycinivorella]